MESATQSALISKKTSWPGIIISALTALFLLFDGVMKMAKSADSVERTAQLGYSESIILPIGITLLACTVVYIIPRAAVLGAILLTGYLGGAVNTHVRVGGGWFPIIFPVIIGALLWGGLYLRDERIRAHIQSSAQSSSVSKTALWAGRIISALPVLLLIFSGVMKSIRHPEVVQGFTKLGYSEDVILGIGIVELACTAVYLIPRAAVIGAILLAGYLGGAVSTHVQAGDPAAQIIAPIVFGVMLWGGLYLRDARLRDLIPLRKER
jgi:hypothetical protein